jgi:hypothetical protein
VSRCRGVHRDGRRSTDAQLIAVCLEKGLELSSPVDDVFSAQRAWARWSEHDCEPQPMRRMDTLPATVRLLLTPSGPDASAQSVGRVARLSGNVRQPNHVLVNEIAGHKAERRPGAGEEWLAATKHDGVEVKSILIYKTKLG